MKDYKLFWENLPETAEEIQASVNHLLSLVGDDGAGTTEFVIPILVSGATFGLTIGGLLDEMQSAILTATLSKEMH